MIILAIDTSGPAASAALMRDGLLVHESFRQHGLTHSQTSMPMVEEALTQANLTPKDVDLFAVVTGPGSFTGVRIGVCEAKALAHAAGKPVLAVDALEALAMNLWNSSALVCPILDARRDQVYGAAFHFDGGDLPVRALEDSVLPLEEYLKRLPEAEEKIFLGDGLRAYSGRLPGHEAPAHLSQLRAAAACAIAAKRSGEATDFLRLAPCYLRAPQAERERAERLANG